MSITTEKSSAALIAYRMLANVDVTKIEVNFGADEPQVGMTISLGTLGAYQESIEAFLDSDGLTTIFYSGNEELGADSIWSLYDTEAEGFEISVEQQQRIDARISLVIAQGAAVIKGVLFGQVNLNDSSSLSRAMNLLETHQDMLLAAANA